MDRALLKRLAPEDGLRQDEQGGCVWCGAEHSGVMFKSDFDEHLEDCPWREVRLFLCETADQNCDDNGLLSVCDFRDYIRNRGYGVSCEYPQLPERSFEMFGITRYKSGRNEATLIVSVAHKNRDAKQPLALAKAWCDEQDKKRGVMR